MSMATGDIVVSAYRANNDAVFARIMSLHVPAGTLVADVTYGRGSFWKKVKPDAYRLLPSDLKSGVDCRRLPYADGSVGAVVFDPPYIEGFYRPKDSQRAMAGRYGDFRDRFSSGQEGSGKYYHAGVLDMYFTTGVEVKRVLAPKGVFVVKCQDEVSNHRQHLTHVEIINEYQRLGFYCKDLFVVVRHDTPTMSRAKRQQHARKNHSYFLVFVKPPSGRLAKRKD